MLFDFLFIIGVVYILATAIEYVRSVFRTADEQVVQPQPVGSLQTVTMSDMNRAYPSIPNVAPGTRRLKRQRNVDLVASATDAHVTKHSSSDSDRDADAEDVVHGSERRRSYLEYLRQRRAHSREDGRKVRRSATEPTVRTAVTTTEATHANTIVNSQGHDDSEEERGWSQVHWKVHKIPVTNASPRSETTQLLANKSHQDAYSQRRNHYGSSSTGSSLALLDRSVRTALGEGGRNRIQTYKSADAAYMPAAYPLSLTSTLLNYPRVHATELGTDERGVGLAHVDAVSGSPLVREPSQTRQSPLKISEHSAFRPVQPAGLATAPVHGSYMPPGKEEAVVAALQDESRMVYVQPSMVRTHSPKRAGFLTHAVPQVTTGSDIAIGHEFSGPAVAPGASISNVTRDATEAVAQLSLEPEVQSAATGPPATKPASGQGHVAEANLERWRARKTNMSDTKVGSANSLIDGSRFPSTAAYRRVEILDVRAVTKPPPETVHIGLVEPIGAGDGNQRIPPQQSIDSDLVTQGLLVSMAPALSQDIAKMPATGNSASARTVLKSQSVVGNNVVPGRGGFAKAFASYDSGDCANYVNESVKEPLSTSVPAVSSGSNDSTHACLAAAQPLLVKQLSESAHGPADDTVGGMTRGTSDATGAQIPPTSAASRMVAGSMTGSEHMPSAPPQFLPRVLDSQQETDRPTMSAKSAHTVQGDALLKASGEQEGHAMGAWPSHQSNFAPGHPMQGLLADGVQGSGAITMTNYRPIVEVLEGDADEHFACPSLPNDVVQGSQNVAKKAHMFQAMAREAERGRAMHSPQQRVARSQTFHATASPPTSNGESASPGSRVYAVRRADTADQYTSDTRRAESDFGTEPTAFTKIAPMSQQTMHMQQRPAVTSTTESIQEPSVVAASPPKYVLTRVTSKPEPKTAEPEDQPAAVDDSGGNRVSIAQMAKYFDQKAALRVSMDERKPAGKRARRENSRFQTQPVTLEELVCVKSAVTTADIKPQSESQFADSILAHGGFAAVLQQYEKRDRGESSDPMSKEPDGDERGMQPAIRKGSVLQRWAQNNQNLAQNRVVDTPPVQAQLPGPKSPSSALQPVSMLATPRRKVELHTDLNDVTSNAPLLPLAAGDRLPASNDSSRQGAHVAVIGDDYRLIVSVGASASQASMESTANLADIQRRREARQRRRQIETGAHSSIADSPVESADASCGALAVETVAITEPTVASSAQVKTGGRRGSRSRSLTQPVSGVEVREAIVLSELGRSVAQRLEALKRSGDEEWKKRTEGGQDDTAVVFRHASRKNDQVGVAERVNALRESQSIWQARVDAKDAEALTVAGKLERAGLLTPATVALNAAASPSAERKPGRSPAAQAFRSVHHDASSLPVISDEDIGNENILKESATAPAAKREVQATREAVVLRRPSECTTQREVATENHGQVVRVKVQKLDEGLANFYASSTGQNESVATSCVDLQAFDHVVNATAGSERLSTVVKNVRPPRKSTTTRNSNPVRALAARIDIQNEYVQASTSAAPLADDANMAMGRKIKESRASQLSVVALAGLASSEDFTAVQLKKSDEKIIPGLSPKEKPYKDVMLVQFKGRKHVQYRLVAPHVSSLSNGDAYVLITPSQLFLYLGKFSNVLEKASAKEFANSVLQKKDLGCRSASGVCAFDEFEDSTPKSEFAPFWQLLSGSLADVRVCTDANEDELYEDLLTATNKIYRLQDNHLLPVMEYWGKPLKHGMLHPHDVLVFDFGSELYVWQGKSAPTSIRKQSVVVAHELFHAGFDYSDCDLNPLLPYEPQRRNAATGTANCADWKGAERPTWAIFGKINHMMETALFQGKFCDWPTSTKLARCKTVSPKDEKKETPQSRILGDESATMEWPNGADLLAMRREEPNLHLEHVSLGRGVLVQDPLDPRRSKYDVITEGVTMWHATAAGACIPLTGGEFGIFYDMDTYVVRWEYALSLTGLKNLSGASCRSSVTGRHQCCYFFWQGSQATVTDQGACALAAVQLDKDGSPQVRVSEGCEPPAFSNLFNGRMTVLHGKHGSFDAKAAHLFRVRGELSREAVLTELVFCAQNLRAQCSYAVLDGAGDTVWLWHGCFSQSTTREIAKECAEGLRASLNVHNELRIVCDQHEPGIFAQLFHPDMNFPRVSGFTSVAAPTTLRIFQLICSGSTLQAVDVPSPCFTPGIYTPFPYLQSALYGVSQPALFLLDTYAQVWLWHGWMCADTTGQMAADGQQRDSAKVQLNRCFRLALETAVSYRDAKQHGHADGSTIEVQVVYAGLEPSCFQALFPTWTVCASAAEANRQEGFADGVSLPADDLLRFLRTARFSAQQLRSGSLPEGLDTTRLECYLHDNEFEELFHMTRVEYERLPLWKQSKLKQDVHLF